MGTTRFDDAVWTGVRSKSLPTLAELAKVTAVKPRESIVVETVIAESGHPFEVFPAASVINAGHRAAALITHKDGDFVLLAEPTGYDRVFHLIGSIPSSDTRWKSVTNRIGSSAPRVTPCFLNHADFAALGTALSEFGDVEVRQMSARHRLDYKSINLGWKQMVGHLRPDHLAAIQEAEDDQASVRSLRLNLVGDHELDVHLRRMAGATFHRGDFDVFASVILPRLAAAAAQRRNLMRNRARHLNQPIPKPIEIVLPLNVFNDADDTGRLLDMVAEHSNLSQAVLHRNPYLHVTVTDHRDGSNFDVLITEPNAIEIRPGFRASTGALTGLAQQLCEHFAADDIRERSADEPVSIYDLFNG